jgi:hypothetical protein
MAFHLKYYLLILSHIYLPTSVVKPALPTLMESRKKIDFDAWNRKIERCMHLEDEVGSQECRVWIEWEILMGRGILWKRFGFGRELFWQLDNWIGRDHRAGS